MKEWTTAELNSYTSSSIQYVVPLRWYCISPSTWSQYIYGDTKSAFHKGHLLYIRLKPKNLYSLNQSILIHLLSKILAFLAFIAFKGPKRPKKAKKKLLPKDLELSNLARNQIKKFSPAKFFSTFKAKPILILNLNWPFLWWESISNCQRHLILEYSPYIYF